jgi:hypothetical protein
MRHRLTAHPLRTTIGYLGLFLALVITLGGTAYAAGRRPPDGRHAPIPEQPANPSDPTGPIGGDGAGNIGARARTTSSVAAKHGGWTNVPLDGGSWTQPSGELELLAGTMVVATPANCTGGFANALTLSVDGQATTFAPAASAPGAGATTLTIPFAVGTLSEPDRDAPHTLTAKFGNSCTKAGEDFTVKDVQVDVLKFR